MAAISRDVLLREFGTEGQLEKLLKQQRIQPAADGSISEEQFGFLKLLRDEDEGAKMSDPEPLP